ncbi:hypothetical protein T484DRAFT_1604895, partial [Baffinella frigidus]
CSSCDAGEYKAATGTGQCSTCPAGTSSASGSNQLTDCMCMAGYSGVSDGVQCSACEAGTFNSAGGAAACETCP